MTTKIKIPAPRTPAQVEAERRSLEERCKAQRDDRDFALWHAWENSPSRTVRM